MAEYGVGMRGRIYLELQGISFWIFTMNNLTSGKGGFMIIFPADNLHQISNIAWDFAFKQCVISAYNVLIFSLSLVILIDCCEQRI